MDEVTRDKLITLGQELSDMPGCGAIADQVWELTRPEPIGVQELVLRGWEHTGDRWVKNRTGVTRIPEVLVKQMPGDAKAEVLRHDNGDWEPCVTYTGDRQERDYIVHGDRHATIQAAASQAVALAHTLAYDN